MARIDLGRAIILLQADDLGVGIILLEIEDVLDVRAAPGVDGLVGIADHADVAMPHRQRVGEDVLGVIGVLIFVDQDVLEALLQLGQDVRDDRGIARHGAQQQIVEIQGVVRRSRSCWYFV